MENPAFVFLIDSKVSRRAAISHMLSGIGIHVEPLEDAGEISWESQRYCTILAEDTPGKITNLLARMAVASNWMPIIAFSVQPTTHDVARAVRDGATDYLQWPFDTSMIGNILVGVRRNVGVLGSMKFREIRARNRIQRLTKREREVLDGVAHGLSNREIGERLAISVRTVEVHRAHMIQKMGVRHSSDAILIAFEASINR